MTTHLGVDAKALFERWLHQALDQWPCGIEAQLRAGYERLISLTTARLDGSIWGQVPHLVRDVFEMRGWAWNGIYVIESESLLRLAVAAGPPVCSHLERRGGVGTSGMCFDAIAMGQALVAASTKRWKGYYSCDGESGLSTQAGMVSPLRDPAGRILGVWDLDSTEPLSPTDGPMMERYFATLSALVPLDAASFEFA